MLLKQLKSPYDGTPPEELSRVQLRVAPQDKYLLHSVYPIKGIETYLLAGVYKNVCNAIRAANITHFTPENANTVFEIITRHLAPSQLAGEGPRTDDKRGARRGGKPHTAPKNKSPDNGQSDPR